MSDVATLFVSWPVGIALSCWLFFEVTRRRSLAEQSVVPRRVTARSISSKHGALSDARRH
jgi:hypothetical protein